ncbi:MAG: hypothetical protein H6618_08985 [Deltaproteobacteria bacterium]|nr:hypothetical protein [Deltaproteobacteria bacterium]
MTISPDRMLEKISLSPHEQDLQSLFLSQVSELSDPVRKNQLMLQLATILRPLAPGKSMSLAYSVYQQSRQKESLELINQCLMELGRLSRTKKLNKSQRQASLSQLQKEQQLIIKAPLAASAPSEKRPGRFLPPPPDFPKTETRAFEKKHIRDQDLRGLPQLPGLISGRTEDSQKTKIAVPEKKTTQRSWPASPELWAQKLDRMIAGGVYRQVLTEVRERLLHPGTDSPSWYRAGMTRYHICIRKLGYVLPEADLNDKADPDEAKKMLLKAPLPGAEGWSR